MPPIDSGKLHEHFSNLSIFYSLVGDMGVTDIASHLGKKGYSGDQTKNVVNNYHGHFETMKFLLDARLAVEFRRFLRQDTVDMSGFIGERKTFLAVKFAKCFWKFVCRTDPHTNPTNNITPNNNTTHNSNTTNNNIGNVNPQAENENEQQQQQSQQPQQQQQQEEEGDEDEDRGTEDDFWTRQFLELAINLVTQRESARNNDDMHAHLVMKWFLPLRRYFGKKNYERLTAYVTEEVAVCLSEHGRANHWLQQYSALWRNDVCHPHDGAMEINIGQAKCGAKGHKTALVDNSDFKRKADKANMMHGAVGQGDRWCQGGKSANVAMLRQTEKVMQISNMGQGGTSKTISHICCPDIGVAVISALPGCILQKNDTSEELEVVGVRLDSQQRWTLEVDKYEKEVRSCCNPNDTSFTIPLTEVDRSLTIAAAAPLYNAVYKAVVDDETSKTVALDAATVICNLVPNNTAPQGTSQQAAEQGGTITWETFSPSNICKIPVGVLRSLILSKNKNAVVLGIDVQELRCMALSLFFQSQDNVTRGTTHLQYKIVKVAPTFMRDAMLELLPSSVPNHSTYLTDKIAEFKPGAYAKLERKIKEIELSLHTEIGTLSSTDLVSLERSRFNKEKSSYAPVPSAKVQSKTTTKKNSFLFVARERGRYLMKQKNSFLTSRYLYYENLYTNEDEYSEMCKKADDADLEREIEHVEVPPLDARWANLISNNSEYLNSAQPQPQPQPQP